MNLFETVKRLGIGVTTLTDWLGSGGVCVDVETAQKRTNTCLECPFNVEYNSLSDSVGKAIKEQIELRNAAGLRTQGIKSIHTCQKCTCYLPLKIFVPIDVIRKYMPESEIQSMPDFCWQKTEPEQ